jgi:hypothetical protein
MSKKHHLAAALSVLISCAAFAEERSIHPGGPVVKDVKIISVGRCEVAEGKDYALLPLTYENQTASLEYEDRSILEVAAAIVNPMSSRPSITGLSEISTVTSISYMKITESKDRSARGQCDSVRDQFVKLLNR